MKQKDNYSCHACPMVLFGLVDRKTKSPPFKSEMMHFECDNPNMSESHKVLILRTKILMSPIVFIISNADTRIMNLILDSGGKELLLCYNSKYLPLDIN